MTVRSTHNGRDTEWNKELQSFIYSDSKEICIFTPEEIMSDVYKRKFCFKCFKFSTKDGQDNCIKNLPDVTSACCGHGKKSFDDKLENSNIYALMFSGESIRFKTLKEMKKYFRRIKE